jgi:integrase/recombinase XerD
MLLKDAIKGFLLDAAVEYSPATIPPMRTYLNQFANYFENRDVNTITPEALRAYFAYLKHDYEPKRLNKKTGPLSGSALDNHWKSIRVFFKWSETNLQAHRPDINLPRPKFILPEIHPFAPEEVKALLAACKYSLEIKPANRIPYKIKLPHADRDTAILLILLDTGVRIGEFCRLRLEDVSLESGEVYVKPFRDSRKSRPRTVFIGAATRKAIWKYTTNKDLRPDDRLFNLTESSIRHTLRHIGEKANVSSVHPHRFRHTFAITYLRNGGDVFTLQRIMGHATLDMVRRYLDLAKSDDGNAHRRASPVDNWRL